MEYKKGKKVIKFKQSAAESLCLARYLGLIIGDLIPYYNVYWQLYITLRKAIHILTSSSFLPADPELLKQILRDHNNQYKNLFGKLKPKNHFLSHDVEGMKVNGPLVHYWGMPFETKNKEIKDYANNTNNHKNLPLSIALNYQLKMANFYKNKSFKYEKIKLLSINNEKDYEINNILPNIPFAKSYKSVEIHNKIYRPGAVVILRIDDTYGPIFRKINKIYEINNEVYFQVTNIVHDGCFNYHYFAYEVKVYDNEIVGILNCNDFLLINSCLLAKIKNSYYITTRHQI